jgi:hypothetical protein
MLLTMPKELSKPIAKATDAQLQNIVKYIRVLQQANGLF